MSHCLQRKQMDLERVNMVLSDWKKDLETLSLSLADLRVSL